MAEYYRIYNWREWPVTYIATLVFGLSEDSRVKRAMTGRYPISQLLQAMMVDRLSILAWQQTKDGASGRNYPELLAPKMMGQKENKDIETYSSGEDFKAAWEKLNGN